MDGGQGMGHGARGWALNTKTSTHVQMAISNVSPWDVAAHDTLV